MSKPVDLTKALNKLEEALERAALKMDLSSPAGVKKAMETFGKMAFTLKGPEAKATYKKILDAAKKHKVNPLSFMGQWGKKYG